MIKIQTKEAKKLQTKWGNKPCNHPSWGKECTLATTTGDYVCLQCGLTVSPDFYEFLRNTSKTSVD